jgi:hypothetical protein
VGGGADHLDAVGVGLARHRHAVLEIRRSVVEVGENVTVQVDHRRIVSPGGGTGALAFS